MTALTIHVPDDTAEKLQKLADKMARSRSDMAARAIEDFVAREAWQIADIEAGLAEAERGEFATAPEIEAIVEKYVPTARRS